MHRALIGLGAFAAAQTLSGCASTISAVKARPVAAHSAAETRLWTSTGERRFVTWMVYQGGHYLLCPEPVPFTAQTIASSAKPNLSLPETLALSTDEAFNTGLTSVGTLTENLAALDRNFANSCNLYIAGVMDHRDLVREVLEDNKLRREFVLLSALKGTDNKELKKLVEASVKEAVEKAKKDLTTTVTFTQVPTAPVPEPAKK